MNRRRRVVAWVLWLGTVLSGLAGPLSVVAQQHNDTVVVSPEETKGLIDSIVAHTDTTNVDTVTGSSVDSGSLEHNNVRADSVVFRSIPDSVTAGWKKDRDFAYANDPAYWKKEAPDDRRQHSFVRFLDGALVSRGFKYFIFSLLAAILLYAIIRIIAENNLRLFYRPSGKIAAGPGEDTSPLEEDLDLRLQQALTAKDHRTAIRTLYLKALRMLNEREIIKYHLQATNREYVQQLSGSEFGEPFRFLTGVYEKVWYGEFAVSDGQFEKLYPYFQDFYKSIGQS
jgi:Domain of unknown function (DUF4129)